MVKSKMNNTNRMYEENLDSSSLDNEMIDPVDEATKQVESDDPIEQEVIEQIDSTVVVLTEVEELEQKVKEQEEKYLRLQADFDNFRKRSQKEKQSARKLANKELLLCILPMIDNLERAIASSDNPDNAITKGVDMVYKQLLEELKSQGVKTIDAVNQKFDPNYHQAVAKEASEDVDSDIVLQEFQKGYLLHEEVLRPTMVKVSE